MSVEILDWYDELDNDLEYLTEDKKIEFAVNVEKFMSRSNISRSDLATKLETSPSYVTKVLKGDSNLTLETMVKFTRAVGGCLHIQITEKNEDIQWIGVVKTNNKVKAKIANQAKYWAKQSEVYNNVVSGAA